MQARNWAIILTFVSACGGAAAAPVALPNEADDYTGAPRRRPTDAVPVGPEVGNTQWNWEAAYCTEGPLDLAASGFAQTLRIETVNDGLYLFYDQTRTAPACVDTVLQHVVVSDSDWQIIEEARVTLPPSAECQGRTDPARPGEVRRTRDGKLEVLVQRSHLCGGLEVRMVYTRAPNTDFTESEIVRRYTVAYNLRDVARIGGLFSDAASLVEPFTITSTGTPFRHDGLEAVRAWYADALNDLPWVALQLQSVEPVAAVPGQWVATWKYMDPRLDAPLEGYNFFTIAVGEIFETKLGLGVPPDPTVAAPAAAGAEPVAPAAVVTPLDTTAIENEAPPTARTRRSRRTGQ